MAMKAIVCLTCMLLQPSLAQALELPAGRLLEQRYQSQLHASTREEAKAHNAGFAVLDPALEKLKWQAKAYGLLSALTDDELEKVRQRDILRPASRGQDYIPQDDPVLARIAEHAVITVSGWFSRLSTSDVVGSIQALRTETKPSSTGSVPVPEQPAMSEPKQLRPGAAQTSPERLPVRIRLPGIVYPGDPGAVPTNPRLLAREQRIDLRAAHNHH